MQLTLESYIQKVKSNILKPEEVISHYLKKAQNAQGDYNAFIRFHEDYIKNHTIDPQSSLAWAPVAIKDNILTKWYISSCASRMLEKYVAPYSATCFTNLEKSWWVMIGKVNMDEFAMGTTNENSYFWPVTNPHGTNRVPWWSSGWLAAAVAADLCIAWLWTDTGWSVRQPAALCGVVWLKPTYGRVSRYGVQSMASSLDQVWTITKTIADAKILLSAIAWYDDKDAQSNKKADQKDREIPGQFVGKKRKIALPKQCVAKGSWIDPDVRNQIMTLVDSLRNVWWEVDEVDMPIMDYVVPIYYTLCPAEVSTNMARFDGIRFGYQDDTMKYDDLPLYYDEVRSAAFGPEVQRRILLWTYVLSSAHYEWFYLKALKARQKFITDMEKVFTQYDLILTPTSPEVAWHIGEKSDDPLKMYLADLYTIPANLAGIPAISVPIGKVQSKGELMPVGAQFMAPAWQESMLFAAGEVVEKIYG